MERDYNDLLNASTNGEIDRILGANPKLIYAIKPDILESLIQQKNSRVLKALYQTS
jgi:hypothetical protein